MLPSNRSIGDVAEDLAEKHLLGLGYKIKDKNWHFAHLELDIVAYDGDQLVIVEVKSRSGTRYAHPSEAITDIKIKRVVEAAEAYIYQKDLHCETRFDVITVIFMGFDFELEHFIDAFYPTL